MKIEINYRRLNIILLKTFVLVVINILLLSGFIFSQGIEPFGLDGMKVNDIKFYNAYLFAATDSGVYRRYIFNDDSVWEHIGLENKKINTVYPHDFGPVSWTVTAGVAPTFTPGDSALIYCACDGWVIADTGINRNEILEINSMDGFPSPVICGETYAAGGGKLFRREISGWYEEVFNIGIGKVNVVRASTVTGDVWIGGETGIFAPYISKSTDLGDSWLTTHPDLGGDNACNSILFDPNDTSVVYAGMEGLVIKTTDGGATWNPTALTNTPYYFYALGYVGFINNLFAGGSTNSNEFGLYYSNDGGDNWMQIQPQKNYTGISGLAIVPTAIPEVYILYASTFGDGVLRLFLPITDVNDEDILPGNFKLFQNYPNPFNPTTKIKYTIPVGTSRRDGTVSVQLRVYDVLGNEIATLINEEKPAGIYEVEFDGTNLTSGIYFYKMQAGDFLETKKMLLLK